MTTVTLESMISRWSDPAARPLAEGRLSDDDGCCRAHGDVLRCAGWTDDEIRNIEQSYADVKVARLLGISQTHSVLLRQIDNLKAGCPQKVLTLTDEGIGSVIGPEWRRILKFWTHIDTLNYAGWSKVAGAGGGAAARNAVEVAAKNAAGVAAKNAAGVAAKVAAKNAAKDARWDARWDAAVVATGEIQGHSQLEKLVFLPMFGFNSVEELDALPE